MSRNRFALSFAQRLHFTGQHSLVKGRSPLGHFHPIQSQSNPLGWTAPSFRHHTSFPFLIAPLGRSAIAFFEVVASDRRRNESEYTTDTVNHSATPQNQSQTTTDPLQFVHTKRDITDPDRSPGSSTTASTLSQAESNSAAVLPSVDEPTDAPTVRSPFQANTEISPVSDPSRTTLDPPIVRKSETHSGQNTGSDSTRAEETVNTTRLDPVQRYPEHTVPAQDSNSPTSHPPFTPPTQEASSSKPRPSEATTGQFPGDRSSSPAIALPEQSFDLPNSQPQVALQRKRDSSTQFEEIKRTSVTGRSHYSSATPLSEQPTVSGQDDAETHPANQGIHRSEQPDSTQHSERTKAIVQPGSESQPELSLETGSHLNAKATIGYSDLALGTESQPAEVVQTKRDNLISSNGLSDNSSISQSITQPFVTPLISSLPFHQATLLLRPLGFRNTLIRPTKSTISQSNARPPTLGDFLRTKYLTNWELPVGMHIHVPLQSVHSFAKITLPQSRIETPSPQHDELQRKESNLTFLESQNSLETTTPTVQFSTDPSIVPSHSDSLPLNNPSDTRDSHSINPIDFLDSESFELNEFGEQLVSDLSPRPLSIRTTPPVEAQSVPLKSSPLGDRPNSSKQLEHQLETLAYPVYYLIRQQWQIEQERQYHRNSSDPNWIRDTRVRVLERSPQQTNHTTLLDSLDPGSPLHCKLQLLAQHVYHLVQWQWAIDRERH